MTLIGPPDLRLPDNHGGLTTYQMSDPLDFARPASTITSRTCYAAPHVVGDTKADYTPGRQPPVDWDATMAFRRHLWSYGIGVAEAMDTSERGPNGLTWSQAKRLISEALTEAKAANGAIVCGAGTEQLDDRGPGLDQITEAYLEQVSYIESRGGTAVVRASHHLVRAAESSDDYLQVYSEVVKQTSNPVIVHWLGVAFDPSLRGYWGHEDEWEALAVVQDLVRSNADHIHAVKFSCLNPELEMELRASLPEGRRVYTGDDYDYPRLLLGDGTNHSHGLLGVLDPLAPVASHALQQLDAGDEQGFLGTMESTVPLAVRMFEPPASDYKTGVVFLAYVSGHQDHFRMVSGREGMRSIRHLSDLFRMTDELGLFADPDLAASRMRTVLQLSGIS